MDLISDTQFVSGADEKPLRVFQEPAAVADILERLCSIHNESGKALPDAANIPVLGLSNKAIQAVDDSVPASNGLGEAEDPVDPASVIHKSVLDINQPPLEDSLARHLLWPEIQKLYGHGYETSAVSVTRDGTLMATACRASSIDHAVIRIYETTEWREICSPLRAHTLTVTDLQWSPDSRYLLSVGRDRIWSISERKGTDFTVSTSKGHTRMILGCSWASIDAGRIFATAGRDKTVKLWQQDSDQGFQSKATIQLDHPVTAVAFLPMVVGDKLWLAAGLESGEIVIITVESKNLDENSVHRIEERLTPRKTINRLAWRPLKSGSDDPWYQLAVASEDSSLRILSFQALESDR
jgi:elongator complex protein 2